MYLKGEKATSFRPNCLGLAVGSPRNCILHGVKCAKEEKGEETKHIKLLYLLNYLLTKVKRSLS